MGCGWGPGLGEEEDEEEEEEEDEEDDDEDEEEDEDDEEEEDDDELLLELLELRERRFRLATSRGRPSRASSFCTGLGGSFFAVSRSGPLLAGESWLDSEELELESEEEDEEEEDEEEDEDEEVDELLFSLDGVRGGTGSSTSALGAPLRALSGSSPGTSGAGDSDLTLGPSLSSSLGGSTGGGAGRGLGTLWEAEEEVEEDEEEDLTFSGPLAGGRRPAGGEPPGAAGQEFRVQAGAGPPFLTAPRDPSGRGDWILGAGEWAFLALGEASPGAGGERDGLRRMGTAATGDVFSALPGAALSAAPTLGYFSSTGGERDLLPARFGEPEPERALAGDAFERPW